MKHYALLTLGLLVFFIVMGNESTQNEKIDYDAKIAAIDPIYQHEKEALRIAEKEYFRKLDSVEAAKTANICRMDESWCDSWDDMQ